MTTHPGVYCLRSNELTWDEKIELDVWYVDHWSFALDMRILIAAVGLLLKREGLYGRDGIAHDFE